MKMLRLAGDNKVLSSCYSSLPCLSNHAATLPIFPSEDNKITLVINNDYPSHLILTPTTSLSPSQFLCSNTDHRMLFHALESCKFSSNSRTTLETHTRIIKHGYGADPYLISPLISLYISYNNFNLARQLLGEVLFWDLDLISANMIIASSMKIGEIDIAKRIFNRMLVRDVVSWNSMIGGYVRNGRPKEALSMFREMLSSNLEPDGFTFSSVVSGCARLGALDHAKWIHGLMSEKRIELNYILLAALIDMYSKCGRVETAKEIFNSTQSDQVSVWNAMINGLAIHGLALEAIELFSSMEVKNILPDSLTFIGILTACSHSGFVEEGRKYFNVMTRNYSIEPQLEHYGAMVDMLGRAGYLEEAYAIITEMPIEPDFVIWRALLGSCRTHKNSKLGEVAIAKILHLKSGDYILLSNIYCSTKNWDSAQRVRDVMKKKGIRKNSGKSWFELGGVIHQFMAGDLSHPETEAIYKVLERLIRRTKMEGFIPLTELVLMDVSEEEKEENLNYHSEKLALAYGILKTSPGSEVRIAKNLRICPDCHSWMEIVSRVLNRVMIVRDRVRFHRFEGGLCSCGGYW